MSACANVSPYARARHAPSDERLDSFFANELGVPAAAFREPGTHIVWSAKRDEPSWGGYLLPILLVHRSGSTVVSVSSRIHSDTVELLGSGRLTAEKIRSLQQRVTELYPGVKRILGHALYCVPEEFTPCDLQATFELRPEDPDLREFRTHFDGPVFVTRNRNGAISAWSALKLKTDDVWEISVSTDARYRGRGLAKVVVSTATEFILRNGRVPLYVHDESNPASRKVARSLGFKEYGREAFCSLTDASPTGIW